LREIALQEDLLSKGWFVRENDYGEPGFRNFIHKWRTRSGYFISRDFTVQHGGEEVKLFRVDVYYSKGKQGGSICIRCQDDYESLWSVYKDIFTSAYGRFSAGFPELVGEGYFHNILQIQLKDLAGPGGDVRRAFQTILQDLDAALSRAQIPEFLTVVAEAEMKVTLVERMLSLARVRANEAIKAAMLAAKNRANPKAG